MCDCEFPKKVIDDAMALLRDQMHRLRHRELLWYSVIIPLIKHWLLLVILKIYFKIVHQDNSETF